MNTTQAICRMREVIRRQHKALSTEDSYVFWLRRYMTALRQMPAGLSSEKKLEQFLTDLACHRDVSASTQNQALNAILYFYREVLGHPLGVLSWGAGSRSSGFWPGRLRREGSRDELACPARGQTNIGGQRMTGPQRRPASLRAFPELGPVTRWPGEPPVSAVFTKYSAVESEGGIAPRAWG